MIVAYRYRTFWPRLLAGFIDGLIFLPVSFLDRYLSSPARGSSVLIGWAIFSYSAYWLYSVLLHARFGQTVGKMLTSVKVMNVSETATPSLKQAFLRDVGYIGIDILTLAYFIYLVLAQKYSIGQQQLEDGLPGTILSIAGAVWFFLEIATMLTNEKRRAFHDYIAGTVVVNPEYQ
jgi:uncharacterized RDD family membrane protein YckC